MKKLALVLVMMLCATTAFAQWGQDNIGLYFAPNPTGDDVAEFCDPAAGGGVFHIYVVGTNMTALSTAGVEFSLEVVGDGQISNFVLGAPGIDFGGLLDVDHTIGFENPEPIINGQFVFAEFDVAIFAVTGPTLGYVGPVYYNSLPEELPAYLDGEDPTLETILPLRNATGDPVNPDTDIPVLILNGDCLVVPNEDVSFGGVKALFN